MQLKTVFACLVLSMSKYAEVATETRSVCLRANFITAESTTTASCCLPCAGITAAQPLLCSVILTVVTEGTPLSLLDTLWGPSLLWGDKSSEQTLANPHRVPTQRRANVKEAQPTAFSWASGSCPTCREHMRVASLSAAVTVGGKVKAMKCLGSNRAWLKQSPWPGQEANFMQLTREDEGG